MAVGEGIGEDVAGITGAVGMVTTSSGPPVAPPPVPGVHDVPGSVLSSLAAMVNRHDRRPVWTTVAASTASGTPGTARPGPLTAWREMKDRNGSHRVEVLVDGAPVLVFTPGDGRITTGLVMPGIERIVDLTIQPGATVRALQEATPNALSDESLSGNTPRSDGDRHPLDQIAREAVMVAVERARAWEPHSGLPLVQVLGGIGYPLLGHLYDLGASSVTTIPRWAEAILAAPNVGHAAKVAFGDASTRPVRRALVQALRPGSDGEVDLAVVALALVGRHVLQADRIARVLAADRVAHAVADLPDPYTLETAAAAITEWGDQRCERILIDAVGRPDGLRMLLTTVSYAIQLGADGPQGRLPSRLVELHDVYRVLMKSRPDPVPGPDPGPRTTTGSASTPSPGAGGVGGSHTGNRGAGQTTGRDRTETPLPAFPHPVLATRRTCATGSPTRQAPRLHPGTRIEHPGAIRPLNGLQLGNLRFVLPDTLADLSRWGRLLSNCLGDFAVEVASGRCSIIGVERGRQLAYAIELTDRGEIRQFNGRANRIPNKRDRVPIITALVEAGVIDPTVRKNRVWVEAVGGPSASPASTGSLCESSSS